MNIEEYFEQKKELQNILLEYITDDDQGNSDFCFKNLVDFIEKEKIGENRQEMIKFLRLLLNISNNHQRGINFISKIKRILQKYSKYIKSIFTNLRLFQFFSSNKIIILFLFDQKMIEIEKSIIEYMLKKKENNGTRYCYFFLPEIKEYLDERAFKVIRKEIVQINERNLENYNEKRQIGENDSYICSLIREDRIEEFISYITRENISHSSIINPSIFETNPLLMMNCKPTLIEYAAFFGSIQIFQFLLLNGVELRPRIGIYAIHSKNAEIIHLLESNNIEFSIECYEETIKCHHVELTEYLENTNKKVIKGKRKNKYNYYERTIACIFKYYNFSYFPKSFDIDFSFFYLCQYNYSYIVKLIIEKKKDKFKSMIINMNNIYNKI